MITAVKLILYYLLYQLGCALALQWSIPFLARVFGFSVHQFAPYQAGVLMILAGVLMIIHLVHFHYVSFSPKAFSKEGVQSILHAFPFLFCTLIIVNLCSEWISLPNWMEETFNSMSHNGFGLASIAIMAPVVEELLFRDAVQGNFLREEMKPQRAIFLSALLFGLVHLNPAQIPFAFCIGLALGWVYYRTGNLLPCIVAHLINNATSATCMATLPPEVLETPLTHYLGTFPTILLLLVSLVGATAGYLHISKRYPILKK